jgi:hypothetical protein
MGRCANTKTKNTKKILFLQRELVVFTVKVKQLSFEDNVCGFDSHPPHKKGN